MKNEKNNKGFSLVELIIVIAIMALLVAIITPSLIQYINKAKKAVDITTAESIGEVFTTELVMNEALYKYYNWHVKCAQTEGGGNRKSPNYYRMIAYSSRGTYDQKFYVNNVNNETASGVLNSDLNAIMQDVCQGIRSLQFQQNDICDYWFIATDHTGKIYVFVGAGSPSWYLERRNSSLLGDSYKVGQGKSAYMIWPDVAETYEHAKRPSDLKDW
ncbi:MAG: type II secretion system protein [Lachnospiraceae bacterium]|nr:type II secretion system protein [Lachnospiraceae bacterium]